MPEQEFYDQIGHEWGLEENKDMYTGFSAAAIPETVQSGKEIFYPEAESVWSVMTEHGLDKVAHLGFSYFGAKSVMKAAETFPEYAKNLTEEREDILSEKVYDLSAKISDPTFQQKASAAILGVAVLGFGKEMTDAYIDYLDMTANMTGASLAILDEYGQGSIKQGGEKAFQQINNILSGQKDNTQIPDGGEIEISEDVLQRQKNLGKA